MILVVVCALITIWAYRRAIFRIRIMDAESSGEAWRQCSCGGTLHLVGFAKKTLVFDCTRSPHHRVYVTDYGESIWRLIGAWLSGIGANVAMLFFLATLFLAYKLGNLPLFRLKVIRKD